MKFLIASIICIAVALSVALFLNCYPPFGQKVSQVRLQHFRRLPNFSDRRFVNPIPTAMGISAKDVLSLLRDYVKGNPNQKPKDPVPMKRVDPNEIQRHRQTRVTWFGHSALLLEIEGKTLLLDPMLGVSPSPFPKMGSRRFNQDIPIDLNQFPDIDAVLLSHDHYDHLDYGTIQALKGKVKHYYVPLGLGGHLIRWGIGEERITEHNWWDKSELDGLQLVCTPARHFSGRSLFDRDATLWSSWVIIGGQSRVYFSGDSGYGPHFQEIGGRYGPFDLTLMECGQYDERWANIHMMPEETVQAHLDVKCGVLFPIHWGAFTLAFHDWYEPIERAVRAARERQVEIIAPPIGKTVEAPFRNFDEKAWWMGNQAIPNSRSN